MFKLKKLFLNATGEGGEGGGGVTITPEIQAVIDQQVAGLKTKNAELLGSLRSTKTELDGFKSQFEGLDIDAVKGLIPGWKKTKTAGRVEIDTDVAKIAIVGSRIASTPGLGARMFTALADRGINIDCISTSEMKVSCIIAEKALDDAARAVHAEFFGQGALPVSPKARAGRAKKPSAVKKVAKRGRA